MMKKAAFVVAAMFVLGMATTTKADAALLTLVDGTDTWTLDVQTGCVVCDITLEVQFGAATARAGEYLDSVSWKLDNPNVTPTNIGFNGTDAGVITDWTFVFANLNANQCGGGSGSSVCGQWTNGNVGGGGYGPIVAGETLFWTFQSTFAVALPDTLTSGNIRAAYNELDARGRIKNSHIFSPGGGNFTDDDGGGGDDGGTIPEPATILLMAGGLGAAAYSSRRRRKA